MAGLLCGGLGLPLCPVTTTTTTIRTTSLFTSSPPSTSSSILLTTIRPSTSVNSLSSSPSSSSSGSSTSFVLTTSSSTTRGVLSSSILTTTPSQSSSSTVRTSTTLSAAASATSSGTACPASDGQSFTARDGSQYLVVCGQDYSTSTQNVFGLYPLTVTSLVECITLCSNQGSVCAGVTYGNSTLQCNLKTRMLRSNQAPLYPVESALRVSGPAGPNNRLQLISNGDFSNSLTPWTSDVFRVAPDTGVATTTWNLANSGRYRAGELVQAVTLTAGQPYFLAFNLSMSLIGTPASTDWCNFYGQTDHEALFFFYPNLTNYQTAFASAFNASGSITQSATRFIFFMYCSGSFDITWTLDNVTLHAYSPTNGSNALAPATSTSILKNGNFSQGLQSWRWVPNGIASTSVPSLAITDITGNVVPQTPFSRPAGTIIFPAVVSTPAIFSSGYLTQDVLLDPGQTFRITAQVYFDVSTTCSCDAGIYNTLRANSGVNGWAWSTFGVNQRGTVLVNVTGTTYASNNLFQMYAGCVGTDGSCSVAFGGVVMLVNV